MDENRLFGVWENALLISLQLEQTSQEAHQSLEELASLVVSLGAKVAEGKLDSWAPPAARAAVGRSTDRPVGRSRAPEGPGCVWVFAF